MRGQLVFFSSVKITLINGGKPATGGNRKIGKVKEKSVYFFQRKKISS